MVRVVGPTTSLPQLREGAKGLDEGQRRNRREPCVPCSLMERSPPLCRLVKLDFLCSLLLIKSKSFGAFVVADFSFQVAFLADASVAASRLAEMSSLQDNLDIWVVSFVELLTRQGTCSPWDSSCGRRRCAPLPRSSASKVLEDLGFSSHCMLLVGDSVDSSSFLRDEVLDMSPISALELLTRQGARGLLWSLRLKASLFRYLR